MGLNPVCGPWIPSSVSIIDVCNIIIISFNKCDIIISNTKGVTPPLETYKKFYPRTARENKKL